MQPISTVSPKKPNYTFQHAKQTNKNLYSMCGPLVQLALEYQTRLGLLRHQCQCCIIWLFRFKLGLCVDLSSHIKSGPRSPPLVGHQQWRKWWFRNHCNYVDHKLLISLHVEGQGGEREGGLFANVNLWCDVMVCRNAKTIHRSRQHEVEHSTHTQKENNDAVFVIRESR